MSNMSVTGLTQVKDLPGGEKDVLTNTEKYANIVYNAFYIMINQ